MLNLLYELFYFWGLLALPIFIYFLIFKETENERIINKNLEWYHFIKKYFAKRAIEKYQDECQNDTIEIPKHFLSQEEGDTQYICGSDLQGNSVFIKITIRESRFGEVEIFIKTANNKIYVLPNEKKVILYNLRSKTEWSVGDLRFWILEPFKRLRIVYNGFLRNIYSGDNQSDENVEYVQFRFIWNAVSDSLHFPQNYSANLIADDLAREEWKHHEWIQLIGDQKGYEQYGALIGFIGGASFPEEVPLHIPSLRKRYFGTSDTYSLERDICLCITSLDGNLFCIGSKFLKYGCRNLRYGSVRFGNQRLLPLEENDIFWEYQGKEELVPDKMTIHFSVDGKDLKCIAHVIPSSIVEFENTENQGWIRKQALVNCIVNGEDARGIISFWYHNQNSEGNFEVQSLLKPSHFKHYTPLEYFALPFTSSLCTKVALAGGKGSSLALLSSIQSKDFIVPKGFIIVSSAFKHFIEKNKKIRNLLQTLEQVCLADEEDGKEEDVADFCERVTNLISKQNIPKNITDEILKNLNAVRSEQGEFFQEQWAVRSSGTLEDSDEFSTAGQNATVLGCKSEKEIFEAVSKCWASLYAFNSVQYRLNHGLPIITDIAVVVQEMIPSDTSGVLFTCHPTTLDVSQMVITSNYGLGESVVSGLVDPDTYIITKTWNGKLFLLSKTIGTKKIKIVPSDGGQGTEEKETNAGHESSLSVEEVLTLGKVGLLLEKLFGSPRDIEWSFYKNKLYLLQSRPVTNLHSWTDYELTHEHDTPVTSPDLSYTKANVGEILPGATTTLSQDIIIRLINETFREISKSNGALVHLSHNNSFVDIITGLLAQVKKEIDMGVRAVELAVFGRSVVSEEMHDMAKKVNGVAKINELIPKVFTLMKTNTNTLAAKAEEVAGEVEILIKDDDSCEEIFKKIKNELQGFKEVIACHSRVSQSNVFHNAITFSILTGNKNEELENFFQDISLILSLTTNAVSAGIPRQLEEIAKTIKKENLTDEFLKIETDKGLEWLENSSEEVEKLVTTFLEKHGHRTFKELELSVSSWRDNPSQFISMIQANCKSQIIEKTKQELTIDEVLSKLVTVKGFLKRKILKYFINKCRSSVFDRERTKCEFVRVTDKFKKAFRVLGKKLVRNGTLPDHELIFHLSLHEIDALIKENNYSLVDKATRRKKLYPFWNNLKFPEIICGIPKPITENFLSTASGTDKGGILVKGTPVYPGDVIARVCSIKTIQSLGELKKGDILITYSTDIGWSPYFPMLSGIVTELGGLISHGAVVAREYGLPCVIGVENATDLFKTGDKVFMSGKKGTLQLLNEN